MATKSAIPSCRAVTGIEDPCPPAVINGKGFYLYTQQWWYAEQIILSIAVRSKGDSGYLAGVAAQKKDVLNRDLKDIVTGFFNNKKK